MHRHQIDYINIFLMLVCCAIAYVFPWPLLIAAYAILGPAHYLTQISWLHDKHYFTRRPEDYVSLALLAVVLAFIMIGVSFYPSTPVLVGIYEILLVSAIVAAFVMANFEDSQRRQLFFPITLSILFLLHYFPLGLLLLLLIPTVIHVYVFTAAFILFGALKSKSWPGVISFFTLLGCGAFFFLYHPAHPYEIGTAWVQYYSSYFSMTATQFMHFFRISHTSQNTLLSMKFIAFAYAYHYMNWFSKTEVIRWHNISAKRGVVITFLYLIALSLYLYDYRLGFIALTGLSLGHVVLEFPLDVMVFRNLGGALVRGLYTQRNEE